MRRHAGFNPMAQYRDPLTVDDVLSSRLVADPLHKFDCCVVSDGGGAVVVTTEERARDLPNRPSPRARRGPRHQPRPQRVAVRRPDGDRGRPLGSPWRSPGPGSTLADVDVLQLYDSFTITVLLTLRTWASAPRAKAAPSWRTDGLAFDGPLPTNTDGGGLSACHPGMRGMFLLVEAVRQLRGEAGATQVPDAEIALVHGTGGIPLDRRHRDPRDRPP